MPEILLFEGLKLPGLRGGTTLGRTCKSWQTVFSPALGRNVRRCADFGGSSGGYGEMGALPFNVGQLKTVGVNAALGVGAAVGARRAGGWLSDMLKLDPTKPNWRRLLEVGIGAVGGWAIGRFAGQPDIGLAVAVGPAMINGMELASEMLVLTETAPTAGSEDDLGLTMERQQALPEWAMQSPYVQQQQQQQPVWSMG